jgi:hypothetical protein
MDTRAREILEGLKEITAPCRPDMHEPDEQELKCRVVGDHLDNACGNYIGGDQIRDGYQEFVVCLERWDEVANKTHKFQINLADLIALARRSS